MAALVFSAPASSCVTIISTVIMASSTSRPSAIISAPSETRCRSIPANSMPTNTAASTKGMEHATTAPARTPRLMKLTASTMPIASHSASMKSSTAALTTLGWSAARCGSTPMGRSALISDIACLMFWPSASTSPPARIEIPIPIAGWPLKRNIGCGGSE